MQIQYTVGELIPYLNWIYFFHSWGLSACYATIAKVHQCISCKQKWIKSFDPEKQTQAAEAVHLFDLAMEKLYELSDSAIIRCLFDLYPSHSRGDDIILYRKNKSTFILPMLRQQVPNSEGYCLCLADFIKDENNSRDDIGVFCTSVSLTSDIEQSLMSQTLLDRLAEAAAEILHQEVRRQLWGYVPNESLSISELFQGKYQGIRPAVGYPCLPDISLNFLLDELLDFSKIGVKLTEHGMMIPHASVSGLMFSHPSSHYFSIGPITEEQIIDYADRRNIPIEIMKKYIC